VTGPPSFRILVVDDNAAIHDDFRRILTPPESGSDLEAHAAMIFGTGATTAKPKLPPFELHSAFQGQEALAMIREEHSHQRSYALAFVDMRMPPGWDGHQTINKLWDVDPHLNVVLCTAYSDYSWDELQSGLRLKQKWLILKKPFDRVEVIQLAQVLAEKWQLACEVVTKHPHALGS